MSLIDRHIRLSLSGPDGPIRERLVRDGLRSAAGSRWWGVRPVFTTTPPAMPLRPDECGPASRCARPGSPLRFTTKVAVAASDVVRRVTRQVERDADVAARVLLARAHGWIPSTSFERAQLRGEHHDVRIAGAVGAVATATRQRQCEHQNHISTFQHVPSMHGPTESAPTSRCLTGRLKCPYVGPTLCRGRLSRLMSV